MSNDSTSHSKQKQDYRKDTLCTANKYQEKDCTGFKSLAGSGMCLHANSKKVPDKEYFTQLFRISKNQIIWGANYYPQYLYHSGWVVWDKQKTDGLLSQAELAFQSINKLVKIYSFQWEGFKKQRGSFEISSIRTIHPNQKPVALYQWLLKNYAKQGDKILDTHLGSGSSAIAADIMGFDFTGIEIDKDYYEAALDRFNRHKQQQVMEF
jgi:site-specific DNA-methyltransferase (adenine-specific)